ncbi:hypothetical protein MtrunA17_Chr7g0227701 [Medicago truncatula]|uniref:Uncharacterized protein n=1 Tax=Medicago truncatula TaxID=3880 RepID=A0A396GY93_MEDTR|nr:hypothetical protein MtrunA17_Chr7g0227701 [Medicago truncatula]
MPSVNTGLVVQIKPASSSHLNFIPRPVRTVIAFQPHAASTEELLPSPRAAVL